MVATTLDLPGEAIDSLLVSPPCEIVDSQPLTCPLWTDGPDRFSGTGGEPDLGNSFETSVSFSLSLTSVSPDLHQSNIFILFKEPAELWDKERQ